MVLIAWGAALAGLAYSAFTLRLLQLGYLQKPRDRARLAVLCAVLLSAWWAWSELAARLTGIPAFFLAGALADVSRYACWFAFMLTLLRPDGQTQRITGVQWLVPAALGLTCFAFLALALLTLQIRVFGDPARLVLFASMALPVLGLVLIEQLVRNMEKDSLWSIKPLCLGLASAFMFDAYVYSQAVLFNQPDADALSIRGVVHALVVPLLVLSSARRSHGFIRMRLSPKAAFHTASLLLAGIYLVFISSAGYYMRFFGGEWGGALQQGLVFVGLIALVVFVFSGSTRAKLRVFLGKHFFHYRFDYREEWLRLTHTLSTQNSSQEMGQLVVQGLADMLESPAGGLWTRVGTDAHFSHTARWNMPMMRSTNEDALSPLCQFITHSGWVVNLEEFRSYPQRYGSLQLPTWLQEIPQAWLIVPLLVGQDLIGFCVLASKPQATWRKCKPPKRSWRRASLTPSTACLHLLFTASRTS
jgi:putative PEP-CTERM system histidine kinase